MRLTSDFVVLGGVLVFLATPGGVVESANLSNRASMSADRSAIGRRCHAMTENFSVFSFVGGPDAEKLGRRAEELRRQLRERWLDGAHHVTWSVRCQVVVHGSRTSYSHSVGRGAAQTKGSSLIRTSGGEVSFRRLDLMADGEAEPSALAHELSHVVLADHFRGNQPPRWADEGIALMSDCDHKQSLHRRDGVNALHRGEQLPLVEILTSQELRDPTRIGAFYGQSLMLVELLVRRHGSSAFFAFLETASQAGYDLALRQCYGLNGIAELEGVWREEVLGSRS